MAEQELRPTRPVERHPDGSLVTPVSKALRAASKRGGWDRDRERPTNPVLDRLEKARRLPR